jgi:hypothetical protein
MVPSRSRLSETEVVKAGKKKLNTQSWFFIIFPPLLLCPLVFVPLDLGSMLFWGPAFIILLVSSWHLLKFIINLIPKKITFQRVLIRPLLTVTIIIGALVLINASQGTADKFARQVAQTVEQKCKKQGRCPEHVTGFDCEPGGKCRTFYGEYGAKYLVRYNVSDDRMRFSMVVRHNIDEALIIESGVTEEMREKIVSY